MDRGAWRIRDDLATKQQQHWEKKKKRKHNSWYIPCIEVTSIYKVIINIDCCYARKLL